MKEITKEGIEKLIKAGVLKNTGVGFINSKGRRIGFYRTKGCAKRRYIEDYFADLALKLK